MTCARRRCALLSCGLVVVAACGGLVSTEGLAARADAARTDAPEASRDAAADAPLPVCTLPSELAFTQVVGACFAARTLLQCVVPTDAGTAGTGDATITGESVQCLAGGQEACGFDGGPVRSGPGTSSCEPLCPPSDYAVECVAAADGVIPTFAGASACHAPSGVFASAEATFGCCPCGS